MLGVSSENTRFTTIDSKNYKFFVDEDREKMGFRAAKLDFQVLKKWVNKGIKPIIILATGDSQKERAKYLSRLLLKNPEIRDTCVFFHMDENIDPKNKNKFVSLNNPMSYARILKQDYYGKPA